MKDHAGFPAEQITQWKIQNVEVVNASLFYTGALQATEAVITSFHPSN